MQALVSIIIPTYNRAHLIGQTLDSVLSQTYKNWECIVVDDGSTDHTDELLGFYVDKDARFRYCQRPIDRPKGANACRNYGFEVSKGEFINWFDSDDLMDEQKITLQIASFQENPQLDFHFCEYLLCDSQFGNAKERHFTLKNLLVNYLNQQAFINLPVTVFRRKALNKIKLDEYLVKSQEVDFFLRLLQNKSLICKKTHRALVSVRLHDDNITFSFSKGNRKSINSEMLVKIKALKYIRIHGSKADLKKFFKLYCKFLFQILDQYVYDLYFKYVIVLFSKLPSAYLSRIFKLIWLEIVVMIFGRRPYRLRNFLRLDQIKE